MECFVIYSFSPVVMIDSLMFSPFLISCFGGSLHQNTPQTCPFRMMMMVDTTYPGVSFAIAKSLSVGKTSTTLIIGYFTAKQNQACTMAMAPNLRPHHPPPPTAAVSPPPHKPISPHPLPTPPGFDAVGCDRVRTPGRMTPAGSERLEEGETMMLPPFHKWSTWGVHLRRFISFRDSSFVVVDLNDYGI